MEKSPPTVNRLAEITKFSSGTVSNRTRNLEGKKLVFRSKEGKKIHHFLTDEGKRILEEWKASADAKYRLSSYLSEIKSSL